jgi:hypothetical protein
MDTHLQGQHECIYKSNMNGTSRGQGQSHPCFLWIIKPPAKELKP